LEDLKNLAKEYNIEFPSFDDSTSTQDALNTSLPTKGAPPYEIRPFLSSHAVPTSTDTMAGIFKIPEGQLIPAPRGGFHYVGPASSFYFANTVRQLVSKCNLGALSTFSDIGFNFSRYLKAAEFTSFKTSQALEARIRGHPATNVTDEEDVDTTHGAHDELAVHNLGSRSEVSRPRKTISKLVQKRGSLLEILPERTLSNRLVDAFFEYIHPNFTIFHRETFFTSYETIWSIASTSTSSSTRGPDPGWVYALMMVYVLGAQALEDKSSHLGLGLILDLDPSHARTLQQTYLTLIIRDSLPCLCLTASLTNVQALMLLSLYQHNAGERNAAWMLLGQASRTAVALGIHRDGENGNFDEVERNTRRMCWWVLHMFEQNLSFVLGRPSNTDLVDVSASLPDETVMTTDEVDIPRGYLERAVALTEMSSRIKRFLASISRDWESPSLLVLSCQTGNQLMEQLDKWGNDLPVHLACRNEDDGYANPKHKRAVALMHVFWDHIKSVLGRPYLLCKVNHIIQLERNQDQHDPVVVPLPDSISYLASESVRAAKSALGILANLSRRKLLEGSVWLDFYYVHHAVLVFGVGELGRLNAVSADSNPSSNNDDHDDGQSQIDREPDLETRSVLRELLIVSQRIRLAPTYRILMNVSMQLAYIVGLGPEEIEAWSSNMSSSLSSSLSQSFASVPTDNVWGVETAGQPLLPTQTQNQNQGALEQLFALDTNDMNNSNNVSTYSHSYNYSDSPPEIFADLVNFGWDTNAENPWDFFNIDALVGTQDTMDMTAS